MTNGIGLLPVLGVWTSRAKCRDSDPDIFHDRENHPRAKFVCESLCPVTKDCLSEGERRRDTFEYAQTWGGVLFPRRRTPGYRGMKNLTRDPRAKELVPCPGCARKVGLVGRHYSQHKTEVAGPACEYGGRQFSNLLLRAEVEILQRIQGGATRKELYPRRKYTDRLKRDKLIVLNKHGGYDLTEQGEQALQRST